MTGPVVKQCGCCGRTYDEQSWSRAEALGSKGYATARIAAVMDYRRCVCGDAMGRTVRVERRAA